MYRPSDSSFKLFRFLKATIFISLVIAAIPWPGDFPVRFAGMALQLISVIFILRGVDSNRRMFGWRSLSDIFKYHFFGITPPISNGHSLAPLKDFYEVAGPMADKQQLYNRLVNTAVSDSENIAIGSVLLLIGIVFTSISAEINCMAKFFSSFLVG